MRVNWEVSWRSLGKKAILLRLSYFGRRCEQDVLMEVMSFCEEQKDLRAGNEFLFGLTNLENRTAVPVFLGRKIALRLNPHNLRNHFATFTSHNGSPLEIMPEVLPHHQDLNPTQLCVFPTPLTDLAPQKNVKPAENVGRG